MSEVAELSEESVPRLAAGCRLRFDKARGQWVVLAPERLFVPDEIAVAILERCDGQTTLAEIVDRLAAAFAAPRETILHDVIALLSELRDKGVVAA